MESEILKKVEELRRQANDQLAYAKGYTAGPQEAVLRSIAASLLGLLELSVWQVSQQFGVASREEE